ncbi:hypothetical protein ISF_08966 [Cordyceps fumosorosea ARSEF 2679]|uniref:Cell wall galactomannoprotein n=1 Tax=Cordyceps fumosorosea (strain ARSEF 2679) TaxID=1081104 RepID=A0A162I6Y9_CORFA|nr:hypothetical protein ISF_08966 [Cordyceps fumosorosea ARSEF 2679]OAA53125.1 hypothetical protein ISF_08966 [Cordyceps fumosorosea ARSEF 2679]
MKFLNLVAAAAAGLLSAPAVAQIHTNGPVFRLAFKQVEAASESLHHAILAFRSNDTMPPLAIATAELVHVVKEAHVNISREDNLGLSQTIQVMLPVFRRFKPRMRNMVEDFKGRRDIVILTHNCEVVRMSIGVLHDAVNMFMSLVRRKIANAAWKTAEKEENKIHNLMIGLKYHYHKEHCQD